jgi:hypothetical protein
MFNRESIAIYQFNKYVLEVNLKDITQSDSLVSPAPGGNCINWIIGHILISRDDLREMLGLTRLCNEEMTLLYKRGSKNIDSSNAMDIYDLKTMLKDGQEELENAIGKTDFSNNEKGLIDLATLAFHEAYHTGQTGILRRITGREGAIK